MADVFDPVSDQRPTHRRRDLEKTSPETLRALIKVIRSLGKEVVHVEGPSDLAADPKGFSDAVVLSIYGGQASRSRMAIVPAMCEALGLRCIGPDAFGRVVAQDKEVSKRLALDTGLLTPSWRVIRATTPRAVLGGLEPPLVVKPLREGSSIGISQASLVASHEAAIALVEVLLSEFDQPVLVERFVAGREVSFSSIESAGEPSWAFSEVVIGGDPGYFETRLFDAGEKLNAQPGRSVRNIDGDLSSDDRSAIERLLNAYGRYGYCRVDGRLLDGQFHFLELTPDAWLGPSGQFAMGFVDKGWTYSEVIAAVLASGPPTLPGR